MFKRFRQYRINQTIRDQYAEIIISKEDLIYPYFIIEGEKKCEEISSLAGIYRMTVDELLKDIEQMLQYGIDKFLFFGVVDKSLKDDIGSAAYKQNNLIQRAISQVKKYFPSAVVISDVCLCGYTSHGHCGILGNNNDVDNDVTLSYLTRMALTHAWAGADFVAPSAMMDGQVMAIKTEFVKHKVPTRILSYSAKFASGLYGPFREAAASAPSFGDRKTYQMDYRTINQALQEVEADIEEGTDWVMVKPAHTYLDILCRIKSAYPAVPFVGYQVSGEYMMIKSAASSGYLNEEAAMCEVLTAIKRAGANYIISYYAKDFVRKGLP